MGSMCTCHTHTGNGLGLEFLASVVEWSQDNLVSFKVIDTIVLKLFVFKFEI